MIEASLTLPRSELSDIKANLAAACEVSIVTYNQGAAILENVSRSGKSGFSCSPHWVGHWAKHVNANIAIATVKRGGQVILALALEIVDKSGLNVAQFVGGSHANANFPAMTEGMSQAESVSFLTQLVAQLKLKPWSIDAIMLERQLEELSGIANPLVAMGSSTSPNVSLSLSVNQSFEAVLDQNSGKRKRKRYRSQQRKFEAVGGFNIVNPDAKEDVEPLLDQYFAMKAHQLRGKGVANVFGNPKEQIFFKSLFSDHGPHHDHHFYLSSLNVDQKTRAIYGCSMHGLRQMVHFTAFSDDELSIASPGDFLNFALIEQACKADTQMFDLGVGDEGYKRSWCDIETWHRDTIIGVSLRGKFSKLQFDGTRSVKRWIKNNEKLWAFAKRVRKLKAGRAVEPQKATEDGSEL
jgi:CelD/BcsL family acetyltransferase involved in cellulose biosynthesis